MARKPDTPCAGCGKLLWGGTTSHAAGQRTCLPCRRAGLGAGRPLITFVCEWCSCEVTMKQRSDRDPKFCSHSCQAAKQNATGVMNGSAARWAGHWPDDAEAKRASHRAKDRARCARRRGLLLAALVEYVEPDVVFERDGWTCHICRRQIDKNISGRSAMGPTIDHLIPLAAGGEHSYANVAAAHHGCNSRRGANGAAQLALTGGV